MHPICEPGGHLGKAPPDDTKQMNKRQNDTAQRAEMSVRETEGLTGHPYV